LGVKIIRCDEQRMILQQRKLRLDIEIEPGTSYRLIAPEKNGMSRVIRERIACGARVRFTEGGKVLLDDYSPNASFEYVE